MIVAYIVSSSHLIQPNKPVYDPHLYKRIQIITNYDYTDDIQQNKTLRHSLLIIWCHTLTKSGRAFIPKQWDNSVHFQ